MLADLGSAISLIEVAETHDDYAEAYRQTCQLLERHPALSGIYVSTANSLAVIKALEESGRLGNVAIVVTDLFPELYRSFATVMCSLRFISSRSLRGAWRSRYCTGLS